MAEIMLTQAFEEAGLGGEVLVDSAGTTGWESGNPIDERAAAKLTELGLASEAHRARQFDPGWYAERDLILALDVDHYEDLKLEAPDAESRSRVRMLREFDPSAAGTPISELGIYDPWYGDRADLVARVGGALTGYAAKNRQYELSEYAQTRLGDRIEPVADVVREKLEDLRSRN